MLEVWTWPTPNGHKVHIALEELGLQYKVIPVDIGAGHQFKPEFLKITPNHRIPAIVDPDGPGGKPFTLFESAATNVSNGSCSRWAASARCSANGTTSAPTPRKGCPTRSSATPTRWRG